LKLRINADSAARLVVTEKSEVVSTLQQLERLVRAVQYHTGRPYIVAANTAADLLVLLYYIYVD